MRWRSPDWPRGRAWPAPWSGFYAPPALQGVITHGGDFFHSHYVDAQRTTTAHLDSFGIAAGSTLMLPKQD